jgi:hypothetical protein
MMKSYRQRMEVSGIADRMSLVTHDHLIKFYEALRFVNKGTSQCTFAGGGWFDMVGSFIVSYDIPDQMDRSCVLPIPGEKADGY